MRRQGMCIVQAKGLKSGKVGPIGYASKITSSLPQFCFCGNPLCNWISL